MSKWIDYPTHEGWWLWNGDQNEGEIVLVLGEKNDFSIADDAELEYHWDKSIMKIDFDDYSNYWEMTACSEMIGEWKLVKELQ